jgi:plasmid stability protein
MDAKLTLKLDKSVIEKAKIYAAEHHHSLSLLVENYLKIITSIENKEEKEEIKISNLAKSFTIKEADAKIGSDYKKELQDILIEKYRL